MQPTAIRSRPVRKIAAVDRRSRLPPFDAQDLISKAAAEWHKRAGKGDLLPFSAWPGGAPDFWARQPWPEPRLPAPQAFLASSRVVLSTPSPVSYELPTCSTRPRVAALEASGPRVHTRATVAAADHTARNLDRSSLARTSRPKHAMRERDPRLWVAALSPTAVERDAAAARYRPTHTFPGHLPDERAGPPASNRFSNLTTVPVAAKSSFASLTVGLLPRERANVDYRDVKLLAGEHSTPRGSTYLWPLLVRQQSSDDIACSEPELERGSGTSQPGGVGVVNVNLASTDLRLDQLKSPKVESALTASCWAGWRSRPDVEADICSFIPARARLEV
ncbi:uncharacterized protein PSFLO_00040 [Pseudozyma flocculosa]|uniref:Uncharacterized protein n=1 Tax=Pseudozyma flocculosa TaxID=84751 RepID=A0A5C3EU08_9BASI|nr:uncharacterized protein PSFLO_00040 [Pseudozyma flocculosa]